jgi:hypothetical protein
VDPAVARNIAQFSHLDQRDRFDEPLIEHVERVAAVVPEEARAVAYLHDVVEHTPTTYDELIDRGLTPTEFGALELLTRHPSDSFELYALRIAHASGMPGRLARMVKIADLDDHLAHDTIPVGAPPYAWARRHVERSHRRDLAAGQAA